MIDPLDFQKRPFLTRLARRRSLTRLVLRLENMASALWRIASWVAFFAGLWLVQLPVVLGPFAPGLFFAVFITGLLFLAQTDLKKLRRPTRSEIDRRLEQISALDHRPLSALEDRLVNPRAQETRKLWQRNQEYALSLLSRLRLPVPRALLAQNDPYALRSFAGLVLVIGIVVAGVQWRERIVYGLFPFTASSKEKAASAITLWMIPPEYTGLPQITLQGSGKRDEALDVPQGSVIKVRVNDGFLTPVLAMGGKELELEELGDKSWGLETEAVPGERIVLKQWPLTRASIAYKYVPDQPPTVTITGAPEPMNKGELKVALKLLDDYGVTDLTMHMDLDPTIAERPLGAPFSDTRAVMSPPGVEQEIMPIYDLAWHPWAGMPVVITFEGVDHLGQKSMVPPLHATLPERRFTHPVAQKLVELRKRLIWTPEIAPPNVAYDIDAVLREPENYQYDPIVTLALKSAASRLHYDPSIESAARVAELLWDTALHLEEGNLPLAARSMQEAQRNLEKLLADPNATDEQIAKAMQDLREAMSQYFQELYRELQKRMAEGGKNFQIPPELLKNAIDPEDLAAFLDQLQSEALSGERGKARELLSQLQQFMDTLDPSAEMTMSPEMQFMMEGISELQQLIEKQQALLEQTLSQSESMNAPELQTYPEILPFDPKVLEEMGAGQMPPPPQAIKPPELGNEPLVDTQQNKVEQDSLRYILGQLMLEADEQLNEIPENMQKAEQEMRGSADRLAENRPNLSVPHQEAAIKYLQESMKKMSQQMQQMLQQMTMMSMGGIGPLDPLGRPMQEGEGNSMFPGGRVKIPDEAQKKRVQDILKTLRQRSGEVSRPDYELEYYRRLMKQF